MVDIFTTYNILIGILVVLIVILAIAVVNLLKKVETYEDELNRLYNTFLAFDASIKGARKFLDDLDEKGTFKSDDEVGTYFDYLQQAQDELDSLTFQDDAKKKSK